MKTAVTADPKAKKSKAEVSAEAANPAPSAVALEGIYGAPAGMPLFMGLRLQRKLAVGAVDDPLEREADQVAEQVMAGNSPSAPGELGTGPEVGSEAYGVQRKCACGGSASGQCEECKREEETTAPVVQRRADSDHHAGSEAPPIVHDALRSPGRSLDAAVRGPFESRFRSDFGDVRVHTDPLAAQSAEAIGALAYTVGDDVVFASGQYHPQSADGRKLLSHELTHVAQQRNGGPNLIRRQLAPELSISMTPEYAAALSDADLAAQISTLQNHLSTLAENDPERSAVETNLQVLRAEQAKRGTPAAADSGAIDEVPRPAGLPMDGAYALYPAPENLQALGELLPEGQMMTLGGGEVEDEGQGRGAGAPQPSRYTSPIGGAVPPISASPNPMLMSEGFSEGVENSIIVVAVPSWNVKYPGSLDVTPPWGHTAVGARIGGKVEVLRGLNPANTMDVVKNYSAVRSGEAAIPAQITDDIGLLTKSSAVTIEYPVSKEVAEAFARQLPPPGPVAAGGPGYTAVPAELGNYCEGQNCVLWAAQQAEQFLKGRIGPSGGTPITDVPRVGEAGQGPLVRFVKGVSERTEEAAPVEEAIGPAVAGEMGTFFKILKVGGRVMFVVSIAMVPIETYLAPEGQRERTFVGASAGLAGGFVGAGIAVSLVCGPGAPVCAIVAGLGGGLVGSMLGRGGAEEVYDALHELKDPSKLAKDIIWSPFGTDEGRRAWCEEAEIEAESTGGEIDPMCDMSLWR
jgi:hypothetical protein